MVLNNNQISITRNWSQEASLCADDDLTQITWGMFSEAVKGNMDNENELNEVISYRCGNPSVYIGKDNGYSYDTWQNEVIVE